MTTNDPHPAPYSDPYGGPPSDPYGHPYASPYAHPYGDPQYAAYYPPPAPAPGPTATATKRRRAFGAGIAALAAAALVGGIAVAESGPSIISGSGSATRFIPTTPGSGGELAPGDPNGGLGNGPGNGGTTGNGTTSAGVATEQQQTGIVTVVSVLKYQNAESAGTGMVLTSDGEVLTNNHVVNGATSITVTLATNGASYRADVVGTAPSEDVAVLQLRNASGLATAKIGDSSDVAVGDKVTGVGNAGGTGTLQAAPGSVTALNQSITATDESGQGGERLTGLIEIDAPIISGDSGGPLYDSSGEVIGMDTAASMNRSVQSTAYAIPIDNALKVAAQIENGIETTTIHIGLPAFLGVGVGTGGTQGATVTSLLDGGPAAAAGITEGSLITRVGGTAVTSADSLKSALRGYEPGKKATITWTGIDGASHTATVTLGTGPAD